MCSDRLLLCWRKSCDANGDMYYSDHQSLAVTDVFLGLIYVTQKQHKADLLAFNEIDALLMSDSDITLLNMFVY